MSNVLTIQEIRSVGVGFESQHWPYMEEEEEGRIPKCAAAGAPSLCDVTAARAIVS